MALSKKVVLLSIVWACVMAVYIVLDTRLWPRSMRSVAAVTTSNEDEFRAKCLPPGFAEKVGGRRYAAESPAA